jgi:DNA-binding transcriptional ArsR family regulator
MVCFCAEVSKIMLEMMVLLGVTPLRLWQIWMCSGSVFEHFIAKGRCMFRSTLDYNVLKLRILRLLSKAGPADSNTLATTIAETNDASIDIHAVRMALMRYYKQGLLKREKVGGVFRYAITERGIQRLRWLEDQAEKSKN